MLSSPAGRLLLSCPALHRAAVHFSPLNDIMYAVGTPQDNEELGQAATTYTMAVLCNGLSQNVQSGVGAGFHLRRYVVH